MVAPVRLSYLGYGLLEAWSACMFFTQGTAALPEAPSLGILSSLAVTLATLALLLLCHRRDAVPNHKAAVVGGSLLNAAATLLILLGPAPLVLAGGAVSGLANAWLWVSWGDVYARLDTEAAEKTAVASATLQAVSVALILWMPPSARPIALALLAPTAGLMYLRACSDLASCEAVETPAHSHGFSPHFGRRFLGRLVAGLGLPIAVLYFLLDRSIPLPELQAGLDMALVAGLLLFMVVLYGFMRFARGFSVSPIFRVVSSLLVIAIVLHALGVFAGIASTLMFAAMLLCQYLLLLYAARLAREGFGTTVFSFAAVQLVNHGSGLVGTLASLGLWGSTCGAAPTLEVVVPTVLVALLFGASLAVQAAVNPKGVSDVPISAPEPDPAPNLRLIASSHGLSPRETEVFELLVRGRSAPFIRDELCISLNTVTSHIKHIYTKLGVHTRQELIDLVDRAQGQLGS